MPATIIAELQTGGPVRRSRPRTAGRTGFAAARAGTKTELAKATEALRVLDVVVPNTLVADAALLAGWHEARRVEASAMRAGRALGRRVGMPRPRRARPAGP